MLFPLPDKPYNWDALDEALRAIPTFTGLVSPGDGHLYANFERQTDEDTKLAWMIANDHDYRELSPTQARDKAKFEARQAAVEAIKARRDDPTIAAIAAFLDLDE